ncbi:hypothetical protein ACPCTO_03220 [Streptomyces olivoreticuli]
MHTHFSAMGALSAFLGVIVVGTLWRLIAAHLVASESAFANHLGRAMAFQY